MTGAQAIRDELLAIKRHIYAESDPLASLVKVTTGNEGMIKTVAAHDTLLTFGKNHSAPDCDVLIEHFKWLPTRQSVVMDLWTNKNRPGYLQHDHHMAKHRVEHRLSRRYVLLDERSQV